MLINWDQRERGRKSGKKSERGLKQHQSHSCPQILPVPTVPTHQNGRFHTDCIWLHAADKLMLINQIVISRRTVCKRLFEPCHKWIYRYNCHTEWPPVHRLIKLTISQGCNGSRPTAGRWDRTAVCNQNHSQKKPEGSWESPTWFCMLSPGQEGMLPILCQTLWSHLHYYFCLLFHVGLPLVVQLWGAWHCVTRMWAAMSHFLHLNKLIVVTFWSKGR